MRTEKVTLVRADGTRTDFAAVYGGTAFMTHEKAIHFEVGDEIERCTPSGFDHFEITNPEYFERMGGHWQLGVRKKGIKPKQVSQSVINLTGAGARMYQNSPDHSTNTVVVSSHRTFADIKKLVQQHADGDIRTDLMKKIEAVEQATDKPVASQKLSDFISVAANSAALWNVLSQYIPVVSQWIAALPGGY
jgi:hypothetical protein